MDAEESEDVDKIKLDALKKQSLSILEIGTLIKKIKKAHKNDDCIDGLMMEVIHTRPILPDLQSLNFSRSVLAIQAYINAFEYNFTSFQLSTYQKKQSFSSMVDYAKILIKKSLPIRCLDGFILAAYLTRNLNKQCIRFPLRFKSRCMPVSRAWSHSFL